MKDAPFLAGHPVRISEIRTIDYFDGLERRWFRVDTDYPKHSHIVVFLGGKLAEGKMACADHPLDDQDCECKQAIREYIKSDAA